MTKPIENKAVVMRLRAYETYLKKNYMFSRNLDAKYGSALVKQQTDRDFKRYIRNETERINKDI